MHQSQTFVHLTKDRKSALNKVSRPLPLHHSALLVRCTKVNHLFISQLFAYGVRKRLFNELYGREIQQQQGLARPPESALFLVFDPHTFLKRRFTGFPACPKFETPVCSRLRQGRLNRSRRRGAYEIGSL